MRILFVISCLSYGGAEKNLMILADYFRKSHEVGICNFNEADTKQNINKDICYYEQQRWIPSEKKFDWINLRKSQLSFLRASCEDFHPNVIVSFLPMPNTLAILCGKRLHIPVIISERADPYQSLSKIDRLNHFIYGFADGAVFQTDGAKDFYQKRLQKKSVVIPNPVILPENCPVHDCTKVNKEIVCVGRFENKQKRQDLAIKAMAIIHQKHPEYKMIFWGDGGDLEQTKKLAIEMNIDDCVKFAGVTNNVLRDINRSEIYLLTSDYEGIPNTLIEAMSIGMPCISTNCSPGGSKMLLEDGKNGVIVPCGNSKKIAEAIIKMIENRDIEYIYGQKAKESLRRFNKSEILSRWECYISQFSNVH